MKLLYIGALWCPSCIIMKPRYLAIIKQNPSIQLEELDFDLNQSDYSSYQIGSKLPVCILLNHQNQEIMRIVGERKTKELQQLLGAYL